MIDEKKLYKEAMNVLKETSRTFYIPITFLQKDVKITVAAAYLMMRAIDEIEDHEDIANADKHTMLMATSELLAAPTFDNEAFMQIIANVKDILPEVTLRLHDWITFCPEGSRRIVCDATSEMATGMAKWAERNWQVHTREDLDDYTYYVAGLVGVMLSNIWEWGYGIQTDRELAIGYGRGLQAVNILRNQEEDMDERGVSFVPDGWTRTELFAYADENLAKGDLYMEDISKRTVLLFCRLPLALAHRTLKALKEGREKITRAEVEETVKEVEES